MSILKLFSKKEFSNMKGIYAMPAHPASHAMNSSG